MVKKTEDILKEIIISSSKGKDAKKSLTREELTDIVVKFVMAISDMSKYEIPNSATFSMALDALEGDGKIFMVTKPKGFSKEVAELVEASS